MAGNKRGQKDRDEGEVIEDGELGVYMMEEWCGVEREFGKEGTMEVKDNHSTCCDDG